MTRDELSIGMSSNFQRVLIFWPMMVLLFVAGCGNFGSEPRSAEEPDQALAQAALLPAAEQQSSLLAGGSLADVAERLDAVAISRSSSLQDVRAARAALNARRYDGYPQLRPTASAPLRGVGAPAVGLGLEQTVWDGGRHRAGLSGAELDLERARLISWRERNKKVFDGLKAYLDIARYEARLAKYSALGRELKAIATRLEARREGGVADRGEVLRMASARQEVERRVLSDTSSLRQAQADFARALPVADQAPLLSDLEVAAGQCRRDWPGGETPADALARIELSRAEASEIGVRAQRFPRLVLSGGSTYSRGGWSEPGIGLRLDASDLLGLGRRGNLDAATASTRSAEASYRLQLEDTQSELLWLDANYQLLRADITALQSLSAENSETLSLFNEQLDAGSIKLTDGIGFYRERTDTLIALIDAHADILLNCLRSSQHRGLLAAFGASDE